MIFLFLVMEFLEIFKYDGYKCFYNWGGCCSVVGGEYFYIGI